MMASLLPMQAVPTGSPGPSSGMEGACQLAQAGQAGKERGEEQSARSAH